MSRTFDGTIFFGKDQKCIVKDSNLGQKLGEAFEATRKGVRLDPRLKGHEQDEKHKEFIAQVDRFCVPNQYEARVRMALKKVRANESGRSFYLRTGVSQGDIILHLKYTNQSFKEEVFFVVYQRFIEAVKKVEKILNLDAKDKSVASGAKVFTNQRGAEVKKPEDWPTGSGGKQKVGVDEALGLFAHGSARCPDRNRVIGQKLAGMDERKLQALIQPYLPDGYAGVITLYGCFTAAGNPDVDSDAPLAQRLFALLKPKFAKVRVRGMPDSWRFDDRAHLQTRPTVVESMRRKPGPHEFAGVNLVDEKDNTGGYLEDNGTIVVRRKKGNEDTKLHAQQPKYFIEKLEITKTALETKAEELMKAIRERIPKRPRGSRSCSKRPRRRSRQSPDRMTRTPATRSRTSTRTTI
jgi:hypothetical protein